MRHTVTFGLLLVVGCATTPAAGPSSPADAELTVAAAALADFLGEPDADSTIALSSRLAANTAQFPDSSTWVNGTDGFGLEPRRYPTLVGSYWRANRRPRSLDGPPLVPGRRVRLIRPSDAAENGVGTVHYVSRVGFNAAADSAIVSVDAHCGMLCGRGVMALYVFRGDRWELAEHLQILQY